MNNGYEKLPESIKKQINWTGLSKEISFNRKADMSYLAEQTVKVINRYHPEMIVLDGGSSFGAYLHYPGRGKGDINFLGMSISGIVKLLDSGIVTDIYASDLGYTFFGSTDRKIVFEQKDLDSGARITIGKTSPRAFEWDRPCVGITIWPENGEKIEELQKLTEEFKEIFCPGSQKFT